MTELHHKKDLDDLTPMQLMRKIEMLEARLQHRRYFAYRQIDSLSKKKMLGSAVIVTFSSLSGKEIIPSFAITDGLSDNLISAIKQDIKETEIAARDFMPNDLKEGLQ